MTTPKVETVPQFSSYLDVEKDVRPWLGLPEGPEPKIDTRLALVTAATCKKVQQWIGKPIAPERFFRRFSGVGGGFANSAIMLPYYPVLKVIKVIEYRGSSGPFELAEQTPELAQGSQEVFQLEPMAGVLIRTFQGNIPRPWFPGSKNIEVTWQAGYNPLPDDIKLATLEYIKRWWDSTQQSTKGGGPVPAGSLGYTGEVSPNMAGAWGDLMRDLYLYEQSGMG